MPQLPGLAPPATLGRQATGADFGALEADARGQRAQVVTQGIVGAVEAGIAIKNAADEMRLGRRAAELSAQIERARFDLEQDPNIDTHEERFGKTTQELVKNAKEGLDPRIAQRLDDRIFPSLAHAQLEVSAGIRRRRLENAAADRVEMLRLNSDQAAQTFDPIRRAQIRGQTIGALDQGLKTGLLDQAAYDASVRTYDRSVSEAVLRRMIRENPEQAFQRLGDPADPISAGFSQAEREQWKNQAISEHESQMAQQRAQVGFQQAQQERAQKLAEDDAMRNADDLLNKGDIASLQSYLAQTRGTMSPEHRRWYLERIAAGGGFGADKTDPNAYIDLSLRASRGEDVQAAVDSALRTGKITKSDRDALLKSGDDRRFGDARRELTEALRVGEAVDNPGARAVSARALADFTDWMLAHPDASREEASKYGRQLQQDAALVNLGALQELRPSLAVPKPGTNQIDIQATAQALEAARQRGEVDDFVYQQQRRRIARWKQLQDAAEVKAK